MFFWFFPGGSDGKEYSCKVADLGSIPGSGGSPGVGNSNPLHIVSFRIPWTIGTARPQSMRLQSQTQLSN